MKRIAIFQLGFILLLLATVCRPVLAHKVRIFAWQDGKDIVTESKFNRGKPAINATVTVTDTATGRPLLSGTTDAKGLFTFPASVTRSKKLVITVDSGDGHKNSWTFEGENTDTGNNTKLDKDQVNTTTQLPTSPSPKTVQLADPPKTTHSITNAELTQLIENVLDKKLAPIKRTLAENSEKKPTLQDILGGIGYILGMAGIAAYIRSTKNKKE